MLDVQDLVVRFGRSEVLHRLSLEVQEGERVSIIGPNGSGKSTTVRAISGLQRIASGSITHRGQAVNPGRPESAIAAGIALVPQGRGLFGSMTVRENLELGAYRVKSSGDIDADLKKWCELFPEVGRVLRSRAANLSGGQQQLVAIVRGLMSRASLLILDEPSMGIAPILMQGIQEVLIELNESMGLTILLVEQNIDMALSVAERVLVLAEGRVVASEAPEGLRDPERLAQLFFFGSSSTGDSVGGAASRSADRQ